MEGHSPQEDLRDQRGSLSLLGMLLRMAKLHSSNAEAFVLLARYTHEHQRVGPDTYHWSFSRKQLLVCKFSNTPFRKQRFLCSHAYEAGGLHVGIGTTTHRRAFLIGCGAVNGCRVMYEAVLYCCGGLQTFLLWSSTPAQDLTACSALEEDLSRVRWRHKKKRSPSSSSFLIIF